MNSIFLTISRSAAIAAFCLAFTCLAPAPARQSTAAETPAKHKELTWAPPNVDTPLPTAAEIAPCPLSAVLQQASVRAVELTATLENFTAQEEIEYLKLNQDGTTDERDSGAFDYTFGFEQRGGGRASQEYRTPSKGGHPFPASSQDTGQVALALIFLPRMQPDYDMKCDGVDHLNGQLAYVVHFEQRKEKPVRTLQFRTEKGVTPVMLRGRAWISAENGQVLRLESNTIQPVSAYKLRSNAIAVDYGPVQIRSRNLQLWLPQRIEAYWEFETYRIILRHTFTNFQVFSVDTQEKVNSPAPN